MTAPSPRMWTLELPAGMKLLNPNDRLHWSEKSSRTYLLKEAAWAVARHAKIPPLESVTILVEYQPPDRRRRDNDNIPAASGKPCIDGIVLAGVLPDDKPPHVADIKYRIGPLYDKGRLVIYLTEVTP